MPDLLQYGLVFAGGVAGSFHCLGMCGGFPLALAANRKRWLARQILYNVGRVNALVAIGALSGAAGAALVASGPLHAVERALAVLAGVFMVVIGLEILGLLSQHTGRAAFFVQAAVGRALGGVMRSRSPAAPLAFGVFNAFLPCSLVYAFAARAASTASAIEGMLTMLCFGAGTVPMMLLIGAAPGWLPETARGPLHRFSGVLVIAFGALTALRGLIGSALHAH